MLNKVLASLLYYGGFAWILVAGLGGFLFDPAAFPTGPGRAGFGVSVVAAVLAMLIGHRWWNTEEELQRHQDADDEVDRMAEKMGHLADTLGGILDRLDPTSDLPNRVSALEDKCRHHRLGGTCPSPTKPLESVGPKWHEAMHTPPYLSRAVSVVSSLPLPAEWAPNTTCGARGCPTCPGVPPLAEPVPPDLGSAPVAETARVLAAEKAVRDARCDPPYVAPAPPVKALRCPICNPPSGVYCCCKPAPRRDPELIDLDVLAEIHDQPTAEMRKPL